MSDFPASPALTPLEATAPPSNRSATAPAVAGAEAPPFLRSLAEITAALKRDIPARLISQKKVTTKKGGAYSADFVHHATIRDLLDHHAPGWGWSVRIEHAAGLLYVVGTLTLVGSDGTQARDGIGNADDDLDGYGDPSSNAEAQALRRAAMAHGLGRALWRK